ncbi:MAG: hypothetical protein ACI3Y7_04300 [Candidatus Cryptobacteroides sp.]
MKETIQELFRSYRSVEAFWAAAENVMTDSYSQTMFLRIANQKNHIVQLYEDIDKIRKLADKGNPYMQFAFARLHDTICLEENSAELSYEYYNLALEGGIADARMHLAFMFRDGDLGEVDSRLFISYANKALEEGSQRAAQFRLHQMIYGSDYYTGDPGKALIHLNDYLSITDDPDPYYYRLKASAEEKLEMKEEAARDYEKALNNGDGESFFLLACLTCCNEQGTVTDGEKFTEIMGRGQDAGVASAYLETACLLNEEVFEELDEDYRAETRELMEDQLRLSTMLGGADAAFLMGSFYEEGQYGFEQDYDQAWGWYSRGALLRSEDCYEALSRMVLEDETAPEMYDEEFGYECAYRGYILGADTLEQVIRGYRSGHLTSHAAVIEEFYLPLYEELFGDGDYDEPEIEEDFAFGYDDPDIVVPEYQDNKRQKADTKKLMEVCEKSLEQAEKATEEQNCPWKVASFAREYADAADVLKGYEHLLNSLYSMNSRMLDLIFDHPRLKLRLCRIQLDVLRYLEAISGHEMGLTEDMANEVDGLSSCIALADQGRLDEIPQTGHLKRDPVEWTERWEEVIDEADRIAYTKLKGTPRGMGWCFSFWSERAAALRTFGIEWRNPHIMNPRVLFD